MAKNPGLKTAKEKGGSVVTKTVAMGLALASALAFQTAAAPAASAAELKVLSEKTVTGFGHVESVAYDPKEKVFYTSDFGPELKPPLKDGKGKITKVSLDGKILADGVFPVKGQVLNKPKGLWIKDGRLWAADIDVVWEFDLKTKQGKKLDLPGIAFANDALVLNGVLYISDNRNDKLAKVEPADFLKSKKSPKVTIIFSGKGVNPNGLWPAKSGGMLMVGFLSKDKPRGIYDMAPGKDPKEISRDIGRLDGLYRMKNGDLLVTDWDTGSLFQWNKKIGKHDLATGFKGPADIAVVPNKKGYLVAVPDLVKGEIRLIQLGK
jgi:hypothetical protein